MVGEGQGEIPRGVIRERGHGRAEPGESAELLFGIQSSSRYSRAPNSVGIRKAGCGRFGCVSPWDPLPADSGRAGGVRGDAGAIPGESSDAVP